MIRQSDLDGPLPQGFIPLPTATEMAWLAGFVDGEGTIGLGVARKRRIISTYVTIPNTNRSNIGRVRILLRALLDHDLRVTHARSTGRRPCYRVAIQNQRDVHIVLGAIMPWLVGKRPQAALMLRYLDIAPGPRQRRSNQGVATRRARPSRYTSEHYELVSQMRKLNKRYAAHEWTELLEGREADRQQMERTRPWPTDLPPDDDPEQALKRLWKLRIDR